MFHRNKKKNPKVPMKSQKTLNDQTNHEQKEQSLALHLDFKKYYKALLHHGSGVKAHRVMEHNRDLRYTPMHLGSSGLGKDSLFNEHFGKPGYAHVGK